MALMTWDESMSVGVRELDAQHQRLVSYLNSLFDAMSKGQGSEMLKPILNGLIEYTVTHFAAEERYMKQFSYPSFAKHKEEHDALTWKAQDLKKKFDAGQSMISVETLTFLKTWLTEHIKGTDQQYGAFFQKNGLR